MGATMNEATERKTEKKTTREEKTYAKKKKNERTQEIVMGSGGEGRKGWHRCEGEKKKEKGGTGVEKNKETITYGLTKKCRWREKNDSVKRSHSCGEGKKRKKTRTRPKVWGRRTTVAAGQRGAQR